jgi:predicted amidohydrolase YtcJ
VKAALLAAAALLCSAPACADTLIDNINGLSVDRDGRVTHFSAMLIGTDGKIRDIVEDGERAPRADYRENGRGRTVVPGMIDAHAHVMGLGLGLLTVDLSDTRTLADAQAKIAAYAAANPERPWIVGAGWNQETWGLGRFPTAAELDAVVSDRPVWLERVDGHAGWANTTAMTIAGVTAATADPAGGRIERLPGGRAPSGVFVDNARALVETKVPPPRATDRDVALYEAQQLLIRNGVTAVADMGTSIEDWMTYRRAGDEGRLRIRIMSYAASVPEMILIGGSGPSAWLYDDRLRLNGLKLYLDGALGSRGAWLKSAYADAAGNIGLPRIDGTALRNNMSRAAMEGYQVAIHAIGDAANAEALSAIEELSGDYTGDRRWRIEHAQIVDPADIPRFGQFGIVASMQPVHQTSDRLMAEARLGPDRLAGAYAWRAIKDAGAALAFGSDTPVETPQPFVGIAAAITRQDASGQPEGGWHPDQRVTREEALAAYTAGAAWAGFAEGRFGELAVGERADFLVLDIDPLEADPRDLRRLQVLETWIGGEKVYDSTPDRETRAADGPGR